MSLAEQTKRLINSVLRDDVHTIKPARITEVNYKECWVSAKPLTTTLWEDDIVTEFDTIPEIPLMINQGGDARITLPVKVGDLCWILFSDRDFSDLLDTEGSAVVRAEDRQAFGGYAIGAIAGMLTRPNAKEFSNQNVVVENASTKIEVTPTSVNITSDENILINGLTMTNTGDIITADGVSLNEFYQSYLQHVHTGNSGNPTSPPTNQ